MPDETHAARPDRPSQFAIMFRREMEAVRFRRDRIAQRRAVAALRARVAGDAAARAFSQARKAAAAPAIRDEDSAQSGGGLAGSSAIDLTGVALSGGGVRSASFCMGVLQALDDLSPDERSDVLDSVDYLSAVSGGNYMATALVAGLMQNGGSFPFAAKRDESETDETRHIRDHASYLAPNGWTDQVANVAIVLRGLVANAVMLLAPLLLLAALAVGLNPTRDLLSKPDLIGRPVAGWPPALATFVLTPVALAAIVSVLVWITARFKWRRPGYRSAFIVRGRSTWAVVGLIAFVGVAFWEWQPLVVEAMFEARDRARMGLAAPAKDAPAWLSWAASLLGDAGRVFLPVAAVAIPLAGKLAKTLETALGDPSWGGLLKRIVGRVGLVLAGLAVPLLLWGLFLDLVFWGVRDGGWNHAPGWLAAAADALAAWDISVEPGGPVAAVYGAAALVLTAVMMTFGPNANSLHQLYRDRLSRAFLMQRAHLRGAPPPGPGPDSWTFSSLKPTLPGGGFDAGAAFAPYLLVNTAINLQDRQLQQHGRHADVFLLSPRNIGSEVTGYAPTDELERRASRLTLASGMAISGAAASAYMGARTLRALSFGLTALNIRLGSWLPNPAAVGHMPATTRRDPGVGPWWFFRELLGAIDSRSDRVYLTDGGHIDNLGLYELLKRRCRVILVVDAEADPAFVFSSFARAQMLARIDFGARVDVPTRAVAQAHAAGVKPEGKGAAGPHVAVGRIEYRGEQSGQPAKTGVLIYIKASLSGDENDFIRDYARRNPSFPHETTLDQFFSEEQFEAYRALGFHIGKRFFTGQDRAAFFDDGADPWALRRAAAALLADPPRPTATAGFLVEAIEALLGLGLTRAQVRAIVDRHLAP